MPAEADHVESFGAPALSLEAPPMHAPAAEDHNRPNDRLVPSTPLPSAEDFGSAEITTDEGSASGEPDVCNFILQSLEGRDLSNDVRAVADWQDHKGLFHNWSDKVEALVPAYFLMLHLINSAEAAQAEVRKYLQVEDRQRRPSFKNPAVLAVRLLARPQSTDEHKAASEYGLALTWALLHQVPPGDFADRLGRVTLSECKKFVRRAAAAKKERKIECGPRQMSFTVHPPHGRGTKFQLIVTEEQCKSIIEKTDGKVALSLSEFLEVAIDLE